MLYDLILMWRIQKSNSFFQFFPFSFSFLPQFFKKVFFLRFLWNVLYNLIMIWKIQKSNSFSQIFSFSVLLLPWLVKNVLKNGWKFFSQIFMKIVNLILMWIIQKPNSFYQTFFYSSLFLASFCSHFHQGKSQSQIVSAECRVCKNPDIVKLSKTE